MVACIRGNLEVFAFLLESDCDKEHYNGMGENTLHKACQVGALDAVRLLIAAGAKKNKAAVRSIFLCFFGMSLYRALKGCSYGSRGFLADRMMGILSTPVTSLVVLRSRISPQLNPSGGRCPPCCPCHHLAASRHGGSLSVRRSLSAPPLS